MSQAIRCFSCFMILMLGACSRSPETHISEGLAHLENGNPSAAFRKFQSAVAKLEEEPQTAPVLNALGVAAALTGKEEDAQSAFIQAADLDPELAVAYINLGILYKHQGKSKEALAAFLRAREADPLQTESLEMQAVESIRQGDSAGALALIRQAVNRQENARTLSSLAVLSADVFPLEERRDLLQRAVSMDPGFAPAQLNLAAFLDQHLLDAEQARVHYENFLRLEPESPIAPQVVQRRQVMEARVLSGDQRGPDPAREEVEALLKRAAGAGDSLMALPLCLQAHAVAARASRPDLRERALRAATTLAPDSARAQVGLARFLQEQSREEEALTAFLAAHALAPQWPPAFQGAVETALTLGRQRQARDLLSQTLEAVRSQPDELLLVADLYRSSLQSDRTARDLYRDLIRSFPESAAAETARERLEN